MKSLWTWFKNKFGRVVTALGGVLMTLDAVSLDPMRPFLNEYFGEKKATRVVVVTAAFFFLLSYIRHQIVANRHPEDTAVLPPPAPGTVSSSDVAYGKRDPV